MHPFLQGLHPPVHIAHRGGSALAPENTLPAFHMAVDRFGTQMLELDVQATADGALIVFHDDTLDRCTDGTGPVAARTLAEVRRLDAAYHFTPDGGATFPHRGTGVRIPTLPEVVEAFRGVRLHIELKPDRREVEPAFAALLEGEASRVCVGSGDDAVARRLVARMPGACHFYPARALLELVTALQAGGPPPRPSPFQVIDLPLDLDGARIATEPLLAGLKGLGKWVNVWTVDDPAEMRRLARAGVGGIMTDRPDLLREVLDDEAAAGPAGP